MVAPRNELRYDASTAMSRHAHTIARIDLRALQPSPDGLLEVLDTLAGIGFEGFALLYEDRFPWALDERLRSPAAYPEHVVAGIHDWCLRRELIHAVELSAFGLTDTLLSLAAFHHLRKALCSDEGYFSVARNMIERVVDDVYALLPDSHLLFSPSSLYGSTTSPAAAESCLAAVSEEHADSPASWSICTDCGPDIRWSKAEPVGDRFDELRLSLASVPTTTSFGAPALRPIAVDEFARLLAQRNQRVVHATPQPLEELFNRFTEAEIDAERRLLAVERALATAVFEAGGRRGGALRHARRAVRSYRESADAMRRLAAELRSGCEPRLSEQTVLRFFSERSAPLTERFASACARLETLCEGFVDLGGSSE